VCAKYAGLMASDASCVSPTKSDDAHPRQRRRERQRYHCKACDSDFDDLTDTIFARHHQPLRKGILYLYLMGLNLSKEQIAQELDLDKDDMVFRNSRRKM
jgi:transposase-like protein